MIGILAALSASAAAGMRLALPLLVIGLLQNQQLWYDVPLLSRVQPPVVLGFLTSWSLFEIFASKKLMGQRILQIIQIILSPLVGALMGMTVAKMTGVPVQLIWIIGVVGSLLALVIQLVKVGWFYRLRGLPMWVVLTEDALCVFLVILAFKAPKSGGVMALILLWLAIRSSHLWYQWYKGKDRLRKQGKISHPEQEAD
jgi:hypothetical protein